VRSRRRSEGRAISGSARRSQADNSQTLVEEAPGRRGNGAMTVS